MTDSVAVSCSDVSFVDDFALLVASASSTDLLDNVRKHVRAHSELLAVFNHSLNMPPGKTDAFVTFRGQGAKDAASKLVHQDDHSHMPLHDGRLLRIVRSYVHLGTLTTPSGSYAQEVSRADYHCKQNKYNYKSEIKSKTIGLCQITGVTVLY